MRRAGGHATLPAVRASIPSLLLLLLACRPSAGSSASPGSTPSPHARPPAASSARAPSPADDGGTATADATDAGPAKVPTVVRDREADQMWNVLGGVGLPTRTAVVARRGALRFAAQGDVAVAGDAVTTFAPHPVVARDGERVQLVIDGFGNAAALLLWVDAADLAPQLARAAVLHADARLATAASEGAITLAAGEAIDVLERKGAAARVRTHEGEFTGWIDASALDVVFDPVRFPLPEADGLAKAGTPILRRPGGKPIYTLPPGGDTETVRVLESRKGWKRIEYVQPCREGVHVQGWVPAAKVESIGPMGTGYGCGGAGGIPPISWGALESAPKVELAADTGLVDERGSLVGRTKRAVELRRGPDGRVRVPTAWGLVAVEVEQAPAAAR